MATEHQPNRESWCVVGAGMLGLRLAQRLADAGQEVTVIDAAPEIGGLAGAWELTTSDGDSITWDKHYHVTLLSDLRNRSLLEELDLEGTVRWVETKTGFYTDGRLHSMSDSVEFLRFPPLRLIDKLRLGGTIFRASKIRDPAPLEHVLVGDWLRKWSGDRTFEKIWQPLLLAKLGEAYKRTSAAFIWATIDRMYRARRTGMKREMFGYVAGGYARVLAKYHELLVAKGVRFVMGKRVASVESDGERVTVGMDGDAAESFDRVVLTTPSCIINRVCQQLGDEERVRHQQVEYLGVVCASVVLDRPISPYYVTNITDGGAPFTAVIEMTALVDPQEFGGRHLIYLPRYAGQEDEYWNLTDDEVRVRFTAALERMSPDFRRDQIAAFRVSRAPHVMALPTLGYSDRLPPMRTSAPGVFAVNSAHITRGTLNVNEVLELADAAFERELTPELSVTPTQPVAV